jgi:hypothetical protein
LNKKLLKTLVKRGLVDTRTRVKIKTKGLSWTDVSFDTIKITNWHSNIKADAILKVDGMDPERFATVYNITPDGIIKIVKKRGRKPKHEQKITV